MDVDVCGVAIVLNFPQNELSILITDFPSQKRKIEEEREEEWHPSAHASIVFKHIVCCIVLESFEILLVCACVCMSVYVAFSLGIGLKLI